MMSSHKWEDRVQPNHLGQGGERKNWIMARYLAQSICSIKPMSGSASRKGTRACLVLLKHSQVLEYLFTKLIWDKLGQDMSDLQS